MEMKTGSKNSLESKISQLEELTRQLSVMLDTAARLFRGIAGLVPNPGE
jgi:hypothetical protein